MLQVLQGAPGAEAICSGATTVLGGNKGDLRHPCNKWSVKRGKDRQNRAAKDLQHVLEQKVQQAARRFHAQADTSNESTGLAGGVSSSSGVSQPAAPAAEPASDRSAARIQKRNGDPHPAAPEQKKSSTQSREAAQEVRAEASASTVRDDEVGSAPGTPSQAAFS